MPQIWKAEDYWKQACHGGHPRVVYDWRQDLDDWLEEFSPAKIACADGHGWITIYSQGNMPAEPGKDDDETILKEWEALKQSGKPIRFSTIKDIAVKNGYVNGKWLFFAHSGSEADRLWRIVAKQFVRDEFLHLVSSLKVSPLPTDDSPTPAHVFVLHHRNYTDEDSVFRLEKALRRAGICEPMKYKPDIYSYLKIYRNNEYKIKSSIYSSDYDHGTCSSVIQRLYKGSSPHRTTFWGNYYVKYVGQSFACVVTEEKEEELNRWLDVYTPSRILNEGWVVLEREDDFESNTGYQTLLKKYEEMQQSRSPISATSIIELAKKHGVVSGGWLFSVRTDIKVDIIWGKVVKEFAHGVLKDVATRVQVSPLYPGYTEEAHVIVAKHEDFTKDDEVHALHDALRTAGVKSTLWYVPDVYSHLGMCEINVHNIKLPIYTSRYDVFKHVSTVSRLHDTPVANCAE